MMCRKPQFVRTGHYFGCGQCGPCRFNRRRVWVHRILLEACQYDANAFVTLTYDDEHLPEGGTLVPSDTQAWLKRLRGRVAPSKFRFFLVGEYGERTGRPHYHAALFGFRSCIYGQSDYSKVRSRCCHWCELVRETWGKGNVYLGTLEADSAGYMAGYVTKGMRDGDPLLAGRHPAFGRMSLRPGIGYSALWEVASSLLTYEDSLLKGDVPSGLRHGSRVMPFGPYLRRSLRTLVGRSPNAPQCVLDEIAAEQAPVRKAAFEASANLAEVLSGIDDGRVTRLDARSTHKWKGTRL